MKIKLVSLFSLTLVMTLINANGITLNNYEPCQVKKYPKVVGGTSGPTLLRKIDFISSNHHVIVAGDTSDQALHGFSG